MNVSFDFYLRIRTTINGKMDYCVLSYFLEEKKRKEEKYYFEPLNVEIFHFQT